jgi:hypothetical protein
LDQRASASTYFDIVPLAVSSSEESYFTKKAETAAKSAVDPTEESSAPLLEETASGTMSKYVDALARWSK